jgi:drug/metabolite transporter (DMT)-like permease
VSDVEAALIAAEPAAERGPVPPARLSPSSTFLLALINLLWAGSAIPAKIILSGAGLAARPALGPYTLAFARFAPAALLLYLMLRVRGRRVRVRREDYGRFFLLGALGLAVTYGIFYGGMRVATATEATLLIAAEPILIALMARLFLGERLRRAQSLGMAAGFAGVYVIVNQGLAPRLSASVIANAVVTLALCFESSASVLGKRMAGRYPGLAVLTVEMLVGAVVLTPFALGELIRHPPVTLAWQAGASLIYLSLICSFFCYGIWFWLLPRFNVSAMAGFLFIQPMMGPVYSYLFLGEQLHPWTAFGAILVILGVWLVAVVGERQRNRTKDE